MASSSYMVPDLPLFGGADSLRSGQEGACWVRFEEEIRRSRFITTLARADSRETLMHSIALALVSMEANTTGGV